MHINCYIKKLQNEQLPKKIEPVQNPTSTENK